jgi:acetoacetyl-[acyl-carrier protein] synthase
VTESQIFDQVAKVFGIESWPVAAIKAYVGHSLAAASGEQLINSLGIFQYGIIPGIKTIDKVADDVFADRLMISNKDQIRKPEDIDLVFINSKGFGGNNATASVIAPHKVEKMLTKRYGDEQMAAYKIRREQVRASAASYDQVALRGQFSTIYHFGQALIDEKLIQLDDSHLQLPGFAQAIDLPDSNPYSDMSLLD